MPVNLLKKVIKNPRSSAFLLRHLHHVVFIPHEHKLGAAAPVFISVFQVRREEGEPEEMSHCGRDKSFQLVRF